MENDNILLKQDLNFIIDEVENTKIKYKELTKDIGKIITVDDNIPFQAEIDKILKELSNIEDVMIEVINII